VKLDKIFLGHVQKETPVIVDMKKAVKGSKRKSDKRSPYANKQIMNFDFTAEEELLHKYGPSEKDSSTVDNIIGEAFTLDDNFSATVHSKPVVYKTNTDIDKQFTIYQNYQDYDANRDRMSHASFKANSDIVYNDGSRKEFDINPYAKQGKVVMNSVKKPIVNYNKQPYPYSLGASSNCRGSKPNSGQRSPLRASSKMLKEESKKLIKKHVRSKETRRKRNFSGTIESADAPGIDPVYIDTEGCQMQ
jgi:hypothetical protein